MNFWVLGLVAMLCMVQVGSCLKVFGGGESREFVSPLLTGPSPLGIDPKSFDIHPLSRRLIVIAEFPEDGVLKVNVTGAIVVFKLSTKKGPFVQWEQWGTLAPDLGALITQFPIPACKDPGFGNHRPPKKTGKMPYPVFEISTPALKELAKFVKLNAGNVSAVIDYDENPWNDTIRIAFPLLGLFTLVFSGFICVIAVYKWCILLSTVGLQLSVAQVVLVFGIISCLIRMVWGILDPFGAYTITNFLWVQVGLTIHNPFVISSALLISLTWHELLKKARPQINNFLDKMFVPFVVWSVLMFAFEFVTAFLRGSFINLVPIIAATCIIYIIVLLSVLIFFIVTRIRLQKLFNELATRLGTRQEEKITLATWHFTGMVISGMVLIVPLILIGLGQVLWHPIIFPIIWFVFYTAINLMCFFQVMLIRVPRRSWKWIFCGLFKQVEMDISDSGTHSRGTNSHGMQQLGSKSMSMGHSRL